MEELHLAKTKLAELAMATTEELDASQEAGADHTTSGTWRPDDARHEGLRDEAAAPPKSPAVNASAVSANSSFHSLSTAASDQSGPSMVSRRVQSAAPDHVATRSTPVGPAGTPLAHEVQSLREQNRDLERACATLRSQLESTQRAEHEAQGRACALEAQLIHVGAPHFRS